MNPRSLHRFLAACCLSPLTWGCGGESTGERGEPEIGGSNQASLGGTFSLGGGEGMGAFSHSGGTVNRAGSSGTMEIGGAIASAGGQPVSGLGGTRLALGGQPTAGAGALVARGGQATDSAGAGGANGGAPATGGAGALGPSGGQPAGGTDAASASGGQLIAGSAGLTAALGGRTNAGGVTTSAGGESSGGAGGTPGCAVQTQTRSSRAARSAGFSGAYDVDYYPLYSVGCTTLAECQTACVAAGGTEASCLYSECIHSITDYCLPPTYWFGLDLLRVEGGSIESSAWIILVNNPYRDQLLASDFQFELPAEAILEGIAVSINRSAEMVSLVADYEVKLLRAGSTVGLDRAKTAAWSTVFQYVNYGGPSDLWGASWTAADLNSTGFGVALTPMYLSTGGNGRAYVDFIRATAYYSLPCS